VPFFMKQLGGQYGKGGDLAEMPADLRVREMPIRPVRFAEQASLFGGG
jgi:hypothetical protein